MPASAPPRRSEIRRPDRHGASGRRPTPVPDRVRSAADRGGRNYWKSNNFSALSDAALDLVIAATEQPAGPECEIFLAQLGGAMARVKPDATAFVGRDARYIMNVHGRWSDPADERGSRLGPPAFEDAAPHADRQRLRQLPDRGRRRARRRRATAPTTRACRR
jgi:hypothetical protein